MRNVVEKVARLRGGGEVLEFIYIFTIHNNYLSYNLFISYLLYNSSLGEFYIHKNILTFVNPDILAWGIFTIHKPNLEIHPI